MTKKKTTTRYTNADFMIDWQKNSHHKKFDGFIDGIKKTSGRDDIKASKVISKIELIKEALKGTGIIPPAYPTPKKNKASITARQATAIVKLAMIQGWDKNTK